MSNFEDDIEPIADPETSLGKRPRTTDDDMNGDQAAGDRNRRFSPEPDEDFDTGAGRHPVWLVKVPKFLIQAWGSIKKDDLRLGTVRVYDPDHTGHQRMELLLPDPPHPPIPSDGITKTVQWNNIPRAYDLKLTAESMATMKRNMFAFKEGSQDVDAGPSETRSTKQRRLTALCGTVTNEASLQPQIRASMFDSKSVGLNGAPAISDEYRELLRRRREEASKPKRTIKMLDQSDAGRNNMLVAGVGLGSASQKSRFNAAIAQKTNPSSSGSSQTEKFARMPKNELLDLLFNLFENWQYWSIKKLRTETQQPESYLREVLGGIADLHKRGPYVGNYSLKPEYSTKRKEEEQQQQNQKQGQSSSSSTVQPENDQGLNDDGDDDDDDEDDFDDIV